MPTQRGSKAPPQFWGVPGEQHVGGVVVAVPAQRLAETRVVGVVDTPAPHRPPVRVPPIRAAAGVGAHLPGATGLHHRGVHRAVAGGGEGGQHRRMPPNRGVGGGEAGVDELPGVAGVEV